MAPARRRGSGRAAAAASAARQQWKVGDLVLAKMKGFPAWPAAITDPRKWGFSSHKKKVLVYFFGTKQIAFCNHVDIEAFTEEKKKSLLSRRHGKGADFIRALDEIIDSFNKFQNQKQTDQLDSVDNEAASDSGNFKGSSCKSSVSPRSIVQANASNESKNGYKSDKGSPMEVDDHQDSDAGGERPAGSVSILDELRQTPLGAATITSWRKRSRDAPQSTCIVRKNASSLRRSRSSVKVDRKKLQNVGAILGREISTNIALELDTAEHAVRSELSNKSPDTSVCIDIDRVISTDMEAPNAASGIVVIDSKLNQLEDDSSFQAKSKDALMNEKAAPEYAEGSYMTCEQAVIQIDCEKFEERSRREKREAQNLSVHCILDEAKSPIFSDNKLTSPVASCSKTVDRYLKADGDEHLPLVKRARARMPEPPIEEKQLDKAIEQYSLDKEESATVVNKNSISLRENTSGDGSSNDLCDFVNILIPTDCAPLKSNYPLRIGQFKGSSMHAEAALPPSKRLHRALEAMSANTSETIDGSKEDPVVRNPSETGDINSSSTVSLSHTERIGECPGFTKQIERHVVSDCNDGIVPIAVPLERPSNFTFKDSSPLKNKSCRLLDFENKSSSSNGVDAMLGDKMTDVDVSKIHQSCLSEDNKNNFKISPDSTLAEPSPSVGGVKSLLEKKKIPCSVEGNVISSQAGELGQKNFPPKAINGKQDPFTKCGHASCLTTASTHDTRSVSPVSLTGGSTSESIKPSSVVTSKSMSVSETKWVPTPKDLSFSPDFTPMKVLIAAAQAKRLRSRYSSLPENVNDIGPSSEIFLSPHFRVGSTDRSSTHSENADYISGSRSPDPNLPFKSSTQQIETHECRSESVPIDLQRINKLNGHEADAASRSFEAVLCTLTRAKESIAHATRRAIDCAKHDIANEVVESIVLSLEKEPSFHRRVDIFFLVDSITRSCRGTAGDVFISLFLPILPRLIAAAAPPGAAAAENRRQCLKVLKLWLERRTFPESIIRHHIRELDSISEPLLNNGFSRRPTRTERALDDPVREMEGMLVDEYGSNTSFHLPGLLSSHMVNDDEEGSDADEKIFEAVTPEKTPTFPGDKDSNLATEKHKHILEDVDGELEMEDVAPSSETITNLSLDTAGSVAHQSCGYQFSLHTSLPFSPPLPKEGPPSPPPLPSSPPPVAPPWQSPIIQQPLTSNNPCSDHHLGTNNHFPLSTTQRPEGSSVNAKIEPSLYFAPGYRDFSNNPPSSVSSIGSCYYINNSGSYPSTMSGVDNLPAVSGSSSGKAYYLQPPPPVVSNQFSYVQSETHLPLTNSSQFGNDQHSGSCFSGASPRRPIQHERCPLYPDNMETPSHLSHFGPPSESSPVSSHNWSHPPRTPNYAYSRHSSRQPGNSFPQIAGASSHWRPQ